MNDQTADTKRASPLLRRDFNYFETITLRWADNDSYGHINNAHYYSFFDTAVDGFLMHHSMRTVLAGEYQTLVVASECRYFRQVSSPGVIQVGVRIGRLGRSSIAYEVAVFNDESDEAAAQGQFVHVCVNRASQRPVAVPESFRLAAQTF
ncbi:acyl-CoA thioesterase [Zwartia panacis]|jgi:acyl-CoA thioester hydrolase|uniref:acyl-CoA thioesterase n=1 Tax=Zwartia panacis TaxID=2683345 RepID=UPI0025B5111B|nr:thioesterase family protein [Zwartia panacis]MDN4017969.1 thioesterase family protein [Zwartia panacis]